VWNEGSRNEVFLEEKGREWVWPTVMDEGLVAPLFADILRAVQDEERAITTHILYKSNLSHDRLTKYLQNLEDGGVAEKVRGEGQDILRDNR
jgi:Winged helix-turn-helix